jgi:hypothetical protein
MQTLSIRTQFTFGDQIRFADSVMQRDGHTFRDHDQ